MPRPIATDVATAFSRFPEPDRINLLRLRDLIFDVAQRDETIGTVHETLKWGQPSYLTERPKSGTTIRLGLTKRGEVALFTHCQTSVIRDFQATFPQAFRYVGNRALLPGSDIEAALDQLRLFIHSALTYHLPGKR